MKLMSAVAVCLGLAGCLGQDGAPDPAGQAAGPSGDTAASVQVAVAGRVAFGSLEEAPPTMQTIVRTAEPLAAQAPEELGVVENARPVFDPNAKSLIEFPMRGGVQR